MPGDLRALGDKDGSRFWPRQRGASLSSLVCQTMFSSAGGARGRFSEFVMLLSILVWAAGALATLGVFVANYPVGDNDPFGV